MKFKLPGRRKSYFAPPKVIKERLGEVSRYRFLYRLRPLVRILLAVVFLAGGTLIFGYRLGIPQINYRVGDISDSEIIAPFTFPVPKTEEEYRAEVEEAKKSVAPVLIKEAKRRGAVVDSIGRFFARFDSVEAAGKPDLPRLLSSGLFPEQISAQSIAFLLVSDSRSRTEETVLRIADRMMERGILFGYNGKGSRRPLEFAVRVGSEERKVPGESIIYAGDLESAIRGELDKENITNPQLYNASFEILFYYLQPNLFNDQKTTESRIKQAVSKVSRNRAIVLKDEKIVGDHERITQEIMDKLVALNRYQTERVLGENRWLRSLPRLGMLVQFALILILVTIYLRRYRREIYRSDSLLFLLVIIVLGILLASQWVLGLSLNPHLEYLVPVPVAGMLVTVLFDEKLAILISFVVLILVANFSPIGHSVLLYAFVGSMTGIYALTRIRYRHDFYKLVFFLTLANVISITASEMVRLSPVTTWLGSAFWGLIAAFIFSVITIGIYPILESIFNLTTDSTILALSDLNHPILKRLAIEAPGTYHHSIVVGNLAESAAEAIGANALLARVGSYYHDIGKMTKPEYFVENLMGAENRHEKLSPTMSALILASHIKDGVEMARKARLPKTIIDFIREHHGTSLMTFFYDKALKSNPGKEVREADFRYPGPRPRSKETAIVLLADSVEAASRTLKDPTPARIRGLVEDIIDSKYRDSELDDSNLTFSDMNRIKESFITILTGIFHARIEYPAMPKTNHQR